MSQTGGRIGEACGHYDSKPYCQYCQHILFIYYFILIPIINFSYVPTNLHMYDSYTSTVGQYGTYPLGTAPGSALQWGAADPSPTTYLSAVVKAAGRQALLAW